MSLTKRYMEDEEKRQALRDVLSHLLRIEQIHHEVEKGIARKIADDGDTKGLTPKQLAVFDNYIEHLIKVRCENEGCGREIDLRHPSEAYENQMEIGRLLCLDCTIDYYRQH